MDPSRLLTGGLSLPLPLRRRRRPHPPGISRRALESDLVWTFDLAECERFVWGFLPCCDRGWGEEACRWGGPFEYRARSASFPGTAAITGGWGRAAPGALGYYRGTSSGDEWVGTEFEHEVVFRHQADGSFEAWGPGSELLTSAETGRRVLLRFVSHLFVGADGALSPRSRCGVTDYRYL